MYSVRDQLATAMADKIGLVKEVLVRTEDARLIHHTLEVSKYHIRLKNLNQSLIGDYKVRCNNEQQLIHHLRHLHRVIDRAARLRGDSVPLR